MIVSSESSHFVNFGDRHALDDVFLAHTEPVFGDVAVQRLSGLFLEFPANMVAAHKKTFSRRSRVSSSEMCRWI